VVVTVGPKFLCGRQQRADLSPSASYTWAWLPSPFVWTS